MEVNADLFRILMSDKVQTIKFQLPLSNAYMLDTFYVRDCYEEYYNHVIHLLDKYKYVTVTGTPGQPCLL
jgi:hypothetical protein